MGRKREIRELGGTPSDGSDEADVVRQAFDTYRDRGEVPPMIRALVSRLEAQPAPSEGEAEAHALFDRLAERLQAEVARQVGGLDELRLGPDLSGVALLGERGRVRPAAFAATIDWEGEGVPLTWSVLGRAGPQRLGLAHCLEPPDLGRLRALLARPPAAFARRYVHAAQACLGPGDEPAGGEPACAPRERLGLALALLEKAAHLDPADPAILAQARRVREQADRPAAPAR